MSHIENLGLPDLNIIKKVLCFDSIITQAHFDLCTHLVENPITLDLPLPHTDKVAVFSKIAGPEYLDNIRKFDKFVPGCYRIWGLNVSEDLCYIGQAKHLGRRVKDHAKGYNKNTFQFCTKLGSEGKVDLFILPPIYDIPPGLTLSEFLCVLEQYLIFKFRPKINKLYIARPYILLDKKAIIKHKEKVSKNIYIYIKSKWTENNLEYIYMSESSSSASRLFGRERSWVKNILFRNKGWYQDTLYFSLCPLNEFKNGKVFYTITENLKKDNEIKSYISNFAITKRKGKRVKITNVMKNEVVIYRSKREAGRVLNADPTCFYSRNKLFRGIYKIEILD